MGFFFLPPSKVKAKQFGWHKACCILQPVQGGACRSSFHGKAEPRSLAKGQGEQKCNCYLSNYTKATASLGNKCWGPGRHFISHKCVDMVKKIIFGAAGQSQVRPEAVSKRDPSSTWCRSAIQTGIFASKPASLTFNTGPVQYIINYHATLNTISVYQSPFHSPLNNRKYK